MKEDAGGAASSVRPLRAGLIPFLQQEGRPGGHRRMGGTCQDQTSPKSWYMEIQRCINPKYFPFTDRKTPGRRIRPALRHHVSLCGLESFPPLACGRSNPPLWADKLGVSWVIQVYYGTAGLSRHWVLRGGCSANVMHYQFGQSRGQGKHKWTQNIQKVFDNDRKKYKNE